MKYSILLTNITITISSLTTLEKKMPSASNLVKKTELTQKINEIEKKITDYNHDKYITNQEFNKLTAEDFAARLKQANLERKWYC